MGDPCVTLTYRLVADKGTTFKDAPTLRRSTAAFDLHLDEDTLRVTVRGCESEETARALVEPFLESWEIHAALEQINGPRFRFWCEGVEVTDPNGRMTVAKIAAFPRSIERDTTQIFPQYPEPPQGFTVTDDVRTLWTIYGNYVAGREPRVSVTAYLCLTWVQRMYTGRGPAGRALGIDDAVLRQIGELSTNVGDVHTARKFDARSTLRDFTPAEMNWLRSALQALVHRVGEVAADPSAANMVIMMNDLPLLAP